MGVTEGEGEGDEMVVESHRERSGRSGNSTPQMNEEVERNVEEQRNITFSNTHGINCG